MKHLHVVPFPGPVERAPGDLMILPVPEDERPLRGDAGVVDWRLEGRISSLMLRGFCSGTFGEATLLPGGRGVVAGRVLLFGMGPAAEFSPRALVQAFSLAGSRAVAVRAERIVLALPESLDLERDLRPVAVGLARTMSGPAAARRLSIVVPRGTERMGLLRRRWDEVAGHLGVLGLEAVLEPIDPVERTRGSAFG